MKQKLWTVILFLVITVSVKSENVALIFIDSTLEPHIRQEFSSWTNQINREGYFKVESVLFPRTDDFHSNRLDRILQIRTIIDARQPKTVVLVGKMPWGYSGWYNPDGHAYRTMASDCHFMVNGYTPSDEVFHGTNVSTVDKLYRNIPNDGFWDYNYLPYNGVVRSVSRIDLSSLNGSMEWNPEYQYGNGCLAGKPICPKIDEIEATKDYFRRNLEYRTGKWIPPKIAYMVGGLWDLRAGQSNYTLTKVTGYTWIRSLNHTDVSGKDVFLLWNNAASTELNLMYRTNDCRNVKPVWVNTYRSYASEPLNMCGTLRRWQVNSLISTWGGSWWVIPPTATTIHDAIMGTAISTQYWIFLYQLMGDSTLPIKITLPSKVTNLRVTSQLN